VAGAMREVAVERFGGRLGAVVLTGSLARDEATIVEDSRGARVLGDAEFLAVFADGGAMPLESELRALEAAVSARLAPAIDCPISVGGVGTAYLRGLRPHIFGYELRTCGQVIHGDPAVLELIPSFGARDIPREDAWRLLCNRIVEYLEVVTAAVPLGGPPAADLRYRTAKLGLDLATSWLVFVGAYRPTYQDRAAAVRELADAGAADAPFDLRAFADDVAACTAFKMEGAAPLDRFIEMSSRVRRNARALWRWELARLAGVPAAASDAAIMARFMSRQSVGARLRGWAFVARHARGRAGARRWSRWAQVLGAPPRLRVYAVASELFFLLEDTTTEPVVSTETMTRWRRTLPVVSPEGPAPERPDWRRLAADVVWNYREFLVGTQA
jgi:hypothetical protein